MHRMGVNTVLAIDVGTKDDDNFTNYGDELTFGIGKVWYFFSFFYSEPVIKNLHSKSIRESMGQTVNARNDVALDTIITNVIIIDSISGIIKADIGIKVRIF